LHPPVSWRTQLPVDLICHVRTGNVSDIARLARLLRGTANTLVLGAGGARGFAHLGVVRALREANVPIDLIGGCSMGSIVGAAVAMEWDDAEIERRLRVAFVDTTRSMTTRCRSFPWLRVQRSRGCLRKTSAVFASRTCGGHSSVFRRT
jgi:NTE family protein